MDHGQDKKREEELDRFWDIDALIPKKTAPHFPADTETAEITIEPPKKPADAISATKEAIPPMPQDQPVRRFIPPHSAEELQRRPTPEVEYSPDNALIHKVKIYRWKSNYRYYEEFARDAARLASVGGEINAPRVPFFSYVPQYAQMSRTQLEWYLCWRACVRRGAFPDTDYSYVLLYAYELINLSDTVDPLQTRDNMLHLWMHYRDTFHQLDSYLPEWICDLSLLYRLPPPSLTGNLLSAVMARCNLKEFYVPSGGEDGYIRALLAFCSNYDYRKSKFCTKEQEALFDKAVLGALREITEVMSRDGKMFASVGMDDSRLMRDAFSGALCSYRIKRKIEVEYCSFSRSHELRYFITDVVKYTENKIRAALGVRSRLTVYALSASARDALDRFLDPILPKRTTVAQKKQAEEAAYEKMYDLPQRELSLSHAAEIERASWSTTEKLIEAFEENTQYGEVEQTPSTESLSTDTVPKNTENTPQPSTNAPLSMPTAEENPLAQAFAPYRPFLEAVRELNSAAQKRIAAQKGLALEVLVDEINALAADLTGDILLEECEAGYCVIEDYQDLLTEMITS